MSLPKYPKLSVKSETADSATSPGILPVAPLMAILIVLGIYFGSTVLAQVVLSIYPSLQGWSADRTNDWLTHSAAVQFAYVALVEAMTILLLVSYLRYHKISFARLGLIRYRLHDFGVTLLAYPPYFILNAVVAVAGAALLHVNNTQAQQTGFESARSTTDLILTFISLVILPPIVEEIVMRGFLFGSLKNGMKVVPAAVLTSVIFATAHLQFGSGAPLLWSAALDTFVLSLVLCYLRQKTGSLWAGIGLHMLKNLIAFLALFVFTGMPNP